MNLKSLKNKMSTNSKKQKGYSSLHLAAQNHDNIVENIVSDTSLCLASRLKQRSHESSGFYLGYLRGRSIPPMLSLQHISNYIGKIIQTRPGQCTWSKYSLSTQSCLKMHWMHQIASRRIVISKNFRHPPRSSWHSATRDFSPKR